MEMFGKGVGNNRERLAMLETRMNRVETALAVYGSLVEVLRRYFKELETLNSSSVPHKQSSDTDSQGSGQ